MAFMPLRLRETQPIGCIKNFIAISILIQKFWKKGIGFESMKNWQKALKFDTNKPRNI